MSKKLEYLSNTTGSGKTEFITNLVKINSNQKYIMVVPNRDLCSEINQRLLDKGVDDIFIINQLTTDKPVKTLKQAVSEQKNRVIITTQAAFKSAIIEGLKFKKDWNLILDEDFSPIVEHEIYLTKATIGVLTTCFDFIKVEDDEFYYDVNPNNEFLNEIFVTQNLQDSILSNKAFRNLVSFSYSKSFNTRIDTTMHNRILEFEKDTNTHKGIKFFSVSMLDVDEFFQFKSVLISSSCYEHSLSYKIFKNLGVKLIQIDLVDEVLCQDFSHVNIKYFTDKNWSTMLRKTLTREGKTVENVVYERSIADIGDSPFIFNANTSFRSKAFKGKLVTSIHGVNKYIKYRNMVYMPSLNATGDLVRFLSHINITRKEIDFDRNVLSAFQFVSRGAVRDRNNKETINMFVMDKRTASFLNKMFPLSNIEYICIARQKQKVPDHVKSFVCRVKKRLKRKDNVRETTLKKFKTYMLEYYGENVK
jgi:hypothetical protein